MVKESRVGCRYTDEENDIISELAGHVSIEAIAKRLGRNPTGLRQQMANLGCLDLHSELCTMSASELARQTGVSTEKVRRWINQHGLKTQRHRRSKDTTMPNHHIRADVFWKWAKQHTHLVQFTDIEKNVITPEPEWVQEERNKEIREQLNKRRLGRQWTKEESDRLWNLYMNGYTQSTISKMLDRPLSSIEKRLAKLRKERF